MANEVNYVPQIDYTSRDYMAIREDLVSLIQTYNPNWTSRDPADFGMTLVDLFAYMGDLLNFYIDRATNEGFLATASQRDSVLQLANTLGYIPTGLVAATTSIGFTNSTGSASVVPAGTQIANSAVVNGISTQIIFETDAAVTVPARVGAVNGTASVAATQGYTVADELLGTSTGAPSQVFKLFNSSVIAGSVQIYINNIEYFYATSLINKTINDPVFSTVNDAEGSTYVLFGDGIGGRIPPTAGEITATYRVGAGVLGNVPIGSITNFLTAVDAGVTATNGAAASGGADEESTDSIRLNAPIALRPLNRAVSLKDYAYLALQVTGVAKAISDASTFNSIVLYIAPSGGTGYLSGITGTTSTAFNTASAAVASYFTDKAAPNVSLTILPPTYVPIDLELTLYVQPQYRQDSVSSQVLAAIRDLVALENSFFADRIPAQFILNAISGVIGVDYATIELLRRLDNKQSFTVSSYTRTSNVATVTTSATHNITVGQKIRVTTTDNSTNNVNTTSSVVTAVGSTTISYTNTGGNLGSTVPTATATVLAIVSETITCAVNEIPTEGTFTISATGGIS
jgi:hypothetical protein